MLKNWTPSVLLSSGASVLSRGLSKCVMWLPLKARVWIASRLLDLSTSFGEWALTIVPEKMPADGEL